MNGRARENHHEGGAGRVILEGATDMSANKCNPKTPSVIVACRKCTARMLSE